MEYTIYPVVKIDDLAVELRLQYGIDMDGCDLASFLFADDYQNDCYKSYYYGGKLIYEGESWQDEDYIRICNCINSILQDIIPDYVTVLIDVSW